MSTLSENLRSKRARPVKFDLGDGRVVEIAPPTLGQAERCLRLEIDGPPKNAAEELVRFAAQARIILGEEHAWLLDVLNQVQISEIVGALYVAASGRTPEGFILWQQAARKAGLLETGAAILERIEEAIIDLSARLNIPPDQAAQMPLADAEALRERIATLERARYDTLATINGVELTWR